MDRITDWILDHLFLLAAVVVASLIVILCMVIRWEQRHCQEATAVTREQVTYVMSGNVLVPFTSTQRLFRCDDGSQRWR